VVIAVIGVLIALLLPAVQMVREAARRASCLNNLKQIGLGLQAYHGTWRAFPPGCVNWRPPGSLKNERQLAWSLFLLPFVEQRPLYDQVDVNSAFDSLVNQPAAANVLPLYICPSSQRIGERVLGRGACDYGGIYGERITSPNSPPKGCMLFDRAVSIPMIRDGTSQTLIISEDSHWVDGQWINGRNVFDQAFAINRAPAYENDIRSEHPGGANGLLTDGSARFLTETMELRILAGLCTRAGNEAFGEF